MPRRYPLAFEQVQYRLRDEVCQCEPFRQAEKARSWEMRAFLLELWCVSWAESAANPQAKRVPRQRRQ